MFCTQCGTKIEDGFKFCSGCGASVAQGKQGAPADSQSELDRIANEIFWRKPVSRGKAEELAKVAGIPYEEAYNLISERYQEYKLGKKQGKFPDTKYCPCCGAQDIEAYEEPGITVIQPVKAFGGGYISSSSPSSKWMRCNMCGHRWKPKKKR